MNINTKQSRIIEYILGVSVFFLFFTLGFYFWSAVGLAFFAWISFRFFNNIGKTIDIRDLIILIPTIQWVLGAWLSYRFSTDTVFYYMSVDEKTYMTFVVPAVSAFTIGIYIRFKKKKNNFHITLSKIQIISEKYKLLYIGLIVLGVIANILNPFMPPSIMFLIYLTGHLQYIGLLLLMQSKSTKGKNVIFSLVLLIMIFLALQRGMFQSILLWLTFLFIVISYIKKITPIKKALLVFLIFITTILVQSVKTEYRAVIWTDNNQEEQINKTTVFSNLLSERLERTELLTSQKNINNIIGRINQGWIISRIIQHTPTYEPFAKGETIIQALYATLLPRFLYLNKKKAGGKENFTRFTGRDLGSGTSMNLSILGEAYANFGKGAILFMFLFGLFLNYMVLFILAKIKKHPVLLFFIPLIFFNVVKAETDFGMVLNYLIKSLVFVAIVFWGLKLFFNVRL